MAGKKRKKETRADIDDGMSVLCGPANDDIDEKEREREKEYRQIAYPGRKN